MANASILFYDRSWLVNLMSTFFITSDLVFNSYYLYFYVKESKASYIVLGANKIVAEYLTRKTSGPLKTHQTALSAARPCFLDSASFIV